MSPLSEFLRHAQLCLHMYMAQNLVLNKNLKEQCLMNDSNLAFLEDWEGEMNIKSLFCIYHLTYSQ